MLARLNLLRLYLGPGLEHGTGDVWSPVAFGNLPYLPCYAAAGQQLQVSTSVQRLQVHLLTATDLDYGIIAQFYVVLKGQPRHPVPISKTFDLAVVSAFQSLR